MYAVFDELCKKKGVRPSDVSRATGISTATLTSWKQGKYTPKIDKLVKIANYFGVPVELFTGGKESGYSVQLTNEELWLIGQYRQIDDVTKGMIQRLLAYEEKMTP